jgi:hypothetical protein
MKNEICMLIFGLALVSTSFSQTTGSPEQFAAQVNSYWAISNFDAIQQAIATRLQANPKDIVGLGVKAYFNVFVYKNLNQAKAAAQSLNTAIEASNCNGDVKAMSAEISREITAIPDSEGREWSASDRAKIHDIFPNRFPKIDQIVNIANAKNTAK